jgi:hypothetical protein
MLKVPNASISNTVLNPLVVSFSASTKKLPAAPLIKTSIRPNYLTTSATTYLTISGFLTSPGIETQLPYLLNSDAT